MAIAFDTTTDGGNVTATSLTWAHTCTGSQLALFVTATVNTQTVTGITYNGVAMSQVGTVSVSSNNSYLYVLFTPATGAHNVVVSLSGSGSVSGASASYTGVYSGSIDSSASTSNTSTSISQATTTVTDNCWLVSSGQTNASTATAGANTTVRLTSANTFHCYLTDSNAAQTPAGSFSQAVTCSNGANAMIVASIAPYDTNPRYWVGGTGTWDLTTKTHWSNSSGGTSGATVPAAVNDAVFNASSGGGTATIGAADVCANLTMTGYTGTLAGSNTLAISGSLTLASTMTLTYSGAITFNSTTSQTITTGTKTILSTLTFNGVGGSWTLQDAFTSSAAITVTNGTLALNGQTVTGTTISNAGTMTTGNGALAFTTFTNTGTLTLGTNTLTLSGTGTVWAQSGTFTASTSTIKITNASSSTKTFSGGGATYNNLWITGSGTGAYTIVGSNTFNDFKCDTPPHTINFTAGTTQTLASFTVSGTAGNLMTLQSTSSGTAWHLHKTTSGTISCDYLSLQDSHVN